MSTLATIFGAQTTESLIIVQTSLAVPWLPFLRALLTSSPATTVCVCILHPPADLLPASLKLDSANVKLVDWTIHVPNYDGVDLDNNMGRLHQAVLDAIASVPSGPITLVVDSPDTLLEDLSSTYAAYTLLRRWHAALESRSVPIRMILPLPTHSPLLPRLLPPAFATSLVHLTLHPPILLHHLATEHLAPPPPHPRFWALFSSAGTCLQGERLVWGDGGTGWGDTEAAVEVLVRRPRGRRVERTIEGWCATGPCELTELVVLRELWAARPRDESGAQAPDPARDLSFSLVLTDTQQHARAQVPLPYAHAGGNGARKDPVPSPSPGMILYDPDSADDLDDDDPDEDLDI